MSKDPDRRIHDVLKELRSVHVQMLKNLQVIVDEAEGLCTGENRSATCVRAILEWFDGDVAHHEVDEEISLLPRLKKVPANALPQEESLSDIFARVSEEHVGLQKSLRNLRAEVEACLLNESPERIDEIRELALGLRQQYKAHFASEERTTMQAAAHISDEDTIEILQEMKARREPQPTR